MFTRVKRKKRRRAGQMQTCLSEEEALLFIALSADDPSRIRRQMFPTSSVNVGEPTDARYRQQQARPAPAPNPQPQHTLNEAVARQDKQDDDDKEDQKPSKDGNQQSKDGNQQTKKRQRENEVGDSKKKNKTKKKRETSPLSVSNNAVSTTNNTLSINTIETGDGIVMVDVVHGDSKRKSDESEMQDVEKMDEKTNVDIAPVIVPGEDDNDDDVIAFGGVHLTSEQKARYCVAFLAKHKLVRVARRTILKEFVDNKTHW